MDDARFDRLARTLVGSTTRRSTLASLLGGTLAAQLSVVDTEAARRRGKRSKRKRCKGGKTRCGKTCCTAPDTCGGGNPGTPGVCGCTKLTCQAGQCGTPSDGCGGTLNCGGCAQPALCGGGGTANVCGCLADGEVTIAGNCQACCSKDCCANDVPGQRVCAGGCG
jgi:hypothetical protein